MRSAGTPPPTRTPSGSPAAAGRWRPSLAGAPPVHRWTRSWPTGASSCTTATITAHGSTAGRWSLPASPPPRPTRRAAASSVMAPANPPECCRKPRSTWSAGSCPPPTRPRCARRCVAAQALLHSYGVTGWQDAAVGAALGQPDVYTSYVDAAAEAVLTARVRAALWWRRGAGLEQMDELIGRRDRARELERFQSDVSEDHGRRDLREPHRRPRLALPGRLRLPRLPARRSGPRA